MLLMTHTGRGVTLLPLAAVAVAMLLLPLVSLQVEGYGVLNVTFLYPSPISDLAWTFKMNDARKKALGVVTARYPGAQFNLRYVENFSKKANKTESLLGVLATGQQMVYSGSVTHFFGVDIESIAKQYPSTRIVHLNGPGIFQKKSADFPSNLMYHGIDIWAQWFVTGAIAGAQLKDGGDICFFYPYDGLNMGINSFFRGMKFASSKATLSVTKIFAFYSPEKELAVAEEFVKRGCRIIVRWADQHQSDLFVASLGNESIMTVGYAGDTALYVGDSVLTSVFSDFSEFFVELLDRLYNNLPLQPHGLTPFSTDPSAVMRIGTVSPRATHEAQEMKVAASAWITANRGDLYCGEWYFMNGSKYNLTNCMPDEHMVPFPYQLESGIVALNNFVAPTACPAGNYLEYDENLKQICAPCPVNTFSIAAGSRSCQPCPAGLEAPAGATLCIAVEGVPPWGWVLIAIGIVLLLVLIGVSLRIALRPAPKPAARAPKGPQVTLIVVAADCKQSPRWRHHILTVCDIMMDIVNRAASDSEAYIVSSVGEVHLVALETAENGHRFLLDVQQQAAEARWPVNVRLRGAVHQGKPRVVERVTHDSKRTWYVGEDVDTVREMFRQTQQEGGVWCSTAAAVTNSSTSTLALGAEHTLTLPRSTAQVAVMQVLSITAGTLSSSNPLQVTPEFAAVDTTDEETVPSDESHPWK